MKTVLAPQGHGERIGGWITAGAQAVGAGHKEGRMDHLTSEWPETERPVRTH